MAEENKIILDADVKPLRLQLREATEELQLARQRFGEFSDEAVEASKKVAGIRDSINAANESAQLFDPGSRFQALTTAASTAAGGIAAAQGALALFGGESEEVEKALLRVQGALALSQGLSQLKDLGKVGEQLKITFRGVTAGMSNFRKALIATGVGALVTALGLLIANFDTVKKVLFNLFPSLSKFTDFIGGMITAVTDFVGITNKAERELEQLSKANARANEDIEARIKLLTAQGGKETEIYNLRKQQTEDELNFLRQSLKTKGELTDEELKRFRELKNTQIVEEAAFRKQQEEAEKKAAEKSAADFKANAEKRKEAQKILDDARNSSLDKQQQEEIAIENAYAEKSLKLKEAGVKDDGSLEEARQRDLQGIRDKYAKEQEAQEKDFQDTLNALRTKTRLDGIKDENEKAREQILLDFEQQKQDVLDNEKLKAEQKTALLLELGQQEQMALDTLQQGIDEKNAEKQLMELDRQMKEGELSFQIQRDLVDQKEALLREQFANGLIEEAKYNEAVKANSEARKAIDKAEYDFKISQAQAASQLLGNLSAIAGRQTAAGKALGISQALINTYVGVTEAIKAKSVLPSPFDVISKVASVATILATGLKAVKAITAVQVPGGGGGGGISAPDISASAPSTGTSVPTLGSSPVTSIAAVMQNQPPVRAFVVESEVTGTQKRVADIERRAGF
jgi:hypothetical protein